MTINRLIRSLFLLYACQQYYHPIVVDAFGISRLQFLRDHHTTTHSSSPNSQLMMAQAETTSEESSATISCVTIDGISSPTLLDNYDTFLLDMWGGEYILVHRVPEFRYMSIALHYLIHLLLNFRHCHAQKHSNITIYNMQYLSYASVMHNGSEPYEGVLQTVEELKKAGKKLIILSNSSKRRENSEKMLIKRERLWACLPTLSFPFDSILVSSLANNIIFSIIAHKNISWI